jgi:hypothetical protein
MVRLRNLVIVAVMATGLAGCASGHWPSIANFSIWHCDSCDDFPMPAYGPGYSMMPGTYTGGPPTQNGSARLTPTTPSANAAPERAVPAATISPPAAATTPPTLPNP